MLSASTKRVLIFGSKGQLGHQLGQTFTKANWQVSALSRNELNLANPDSKVLLSQLDRLLDIHQPDWIINAAAYTAVDRAEQEPEVAMRVNAWFPGILGQRSKGAGLVHFSTDYVFDGKLNRPYRESDLPAPANVYGLSKWRGEQALLEAQAQAMVIRCSWVVGSQGQNFAKTMLHLACEREQLQVVSDQLGVPTPTSWLADQVLSVLLSDAKDVHRHRLAGVYHVVPEGQTNWYAYAKYLIKQALSHPDWAQSIRIKPEFVEAVNSSAYPVLAKRPQNSSLDCERWRLATGQSSLTDWQQALAPVLNTLLSSGPLTLSARNARLGVASRD
jgi:dTDP-4-dehydrorhamnose reductase